MIKDSGERRKFESGAVRDITPGKGRCDLIPLKIIATVYKDVVLMGISNFQSSGNPQYLIDCLIYYCGKDYQKILDLAVHFEEGAKKYGPFNWQKGIPVSSFIDSAIRHYCKNKAGWKDEPHDRAFIWNLVCCVWTCQEKPELNSYRKEKTNEG